MWCLVLYVTVVVPCLSIAIVFFFKHKTAYEMRISDWSSDACSSDLTVQRDGDGYWVRAWVRVDAAGLADVGAAPIDRYARAVAALPEVTRQVLLADFLGDEDFTAIAARLGITKIGRAHV